MSASVEVPDDPPLQAATHVLSRPIAMSRAQFQLRGNVDATGDDLPMDTSLIFLEICGIFWRIAWSWKRGAMGVPVHRASG
jgi:hypothetical protein